MQVCKRCPITAVHKLGLLNTNLTPAYRHLHKCKFACVQLFCFIIFFISIRSAGVYFIKHVYCSVSTSGKVCETDCGSVTSMCLFEDGCRKGGKVVSIMSKKTLIEARRL